MKFHLKQNLCLMLIVSSLLCLNFKKSK